MQNKNVNKVYVKKTNEKKNKEKYFIISMIFSNTTIFF